MNKVHLISAPTSEKRRNYPFSLIYLQSYLKKNGFDCEVLDCNVLGWSLKDLVEYLETDKAKIVGLTGYTYNRFFTYDAIKAIKSKLPACRLIVGGRHFSALAVETLEHLKEVDYVVRGEGEVTLKELCEAIRDNKAVSDIQGITFRDSGKIISNPDRPLVLNLDELHYDLEDLTHLKGDYSFTSKMRRFTNTEGFAVMAGRGCIGQCVFCSLSSNRIRLRSIASVLDEIEQMISITGRRYVTFADPSLTASSKYLIELCEEILKRNLNIKWRCYSRADAPPKVFELMKRAGCGAVDIALESASPRVLKAIKKYIKVEDVQSCVKKLHELGIRSFVYAMISLPDEHEEDVEMTIRFLEDIADMIGGTTLAITQIFPDAALYGMAKERKLLPMTFNWFDDFYNDYYDKSNLRSTAPFYLEYLSLDFIKKMRKRFEGMYLKKFYNRDIFQREFKKVLIPFLFDWKRQTLGSKLRRIKNGLVRLPYAFKKAK